MEQFKEWYNGLEQTEKQLVQAASILLALLILYFALIKPLGDSVDSLQQQVKSRQSSVEQWKSNMPLLVKSRKSGGNSNATQSLSNVITSSSRRYQLRVSRVQEKNPNEMQVWFDKVPFNNFLRWVAELENKYQVTVDSVNVRSKDRDGLSSIDIKILRG